MVHEQSSTIDDLLWVLATETAKSFWQFVAVELQMRSEIKLGKFASSIYCSRPAARGRTDCKVCVPCTCDQLDEFPVTVTVGKR